MKVIKETQSGFIECFLFDQLRVFYTSCIFYGDQAQMIIRYNLAILSSWKDFLTELEHHGAIYPNHKFPKMKTQRYSGLQGPKDQ